LLFSYFLLSSFSFLLSSCVLLPELSWNVLLDYFCLEPLLDSVFYDGAWWARMGLALQVFFRRFTQFCVKLNLFMPLEMFVVSSRIAEL
jgi:hypothetical protein